MTSPSVLPGTGPSGETPQDPEGRSRRVPRWALWVGAMVTLMLAAGAVAGTAAIKTDDVLFSPGEARGTEGRVKISGAESYPATGDVFFATVSVRQATLFDDLFRRPLDDTLRFTPLDEVYPDGNKAAVDAANENAMDDSKTVASVVALQHLGKEVTFSGDGVAVLEVDEERPAQGRLDPGDLIVSADGERVQLTDDLHRVLAAKSPGDTVELEVRRGAAPLEGAAPEETPEPETVSVGLEAGPDGDPIMGIRVSDYNLDVELPFDITLNSGEVTGPSAGLAWTLAIVDELTPGELTGGENIAATGTIAPDGSVGAIGGLPQKAAAVRRLGAKVFLIPEGLPSDEVAQAKKIAGDDVRLVEVADLDEAIERIEELTG
ncbi:MAG: PDZ domain-containing protein [Microthrixaceae bacterium]